MKKLIRRAGLALFGLFFSVLLMAASCATAKNGNLVIRGTVTIYGNEPHTYPGITDEKDGKTYAVYPPEMEEKVRGLQGYLADFTVRLLDEPSGYGGMFLKDGTLEVLSWVIVD